ncbi:hypothetical protein Pint_15125 [Pistacia integerrima]|uniref:Uncharacterized protein n=1 Tax=Pistacia integerrima TaxID=434235 RepID=A0ACC0ZBP0_9ROSI|nr:hypothetical protein Pint_15125 [Pistacia integerrima]
MSRYVCCAGYMPCSGKCYESSCTELCLGTEVWVLFVSAVALFFMVYVLSFLVKTQLWNLWLQDMPTFFSYSFYFKKENIGFVCSAFSIHRMPSPKSSLFNEMMNLTCFDVKLIRYKLPWQL